MALLRDPPEVRRFSQPAPYRGCEMSWREREMRLMCDPSVGRHQYYHDSEGWFWELFEGEWIALLREAV